MQMLPAPLMCKFCSLSPPRRVLTRRERYLWNPRTTPGKAAMRNEGCEASVCENIILQKFLRSMVFDIFPRLGFCVILKTSLKSMVKKIIFCTRILPPRLTVCGCDAQDERAEIHHPLSLNDVKRRSPFMNK